MPKSQLPTWVAPVSAVLGLLLTAVCAWWQIRRDHNEVKRRGIIVRPPDTWLHTIILLAGCVVPVVALTMLKDNREGGAQPVLALLLALTGLGCWGFIATRIHGRVEVGVGLVCGVVMSVGAFVYSIAKLSK